MNVSPENQFFPVSPLLQRDVIGIRLSQGFLEDSSTIKTCAIMAPGLVFQIGKRGPCIEKLTTRSATYSPIPLLFLHGCRPEPSVMHFYAGSYSSLQVAFQPWALRTVFGLNGREMIAKPLNAAAFGGAELEANLVRTSSIEERVRLLDDFLQSKFEQYGQRDELVEESVTYINDHVMSITAGLLTSHLGVTSRVLEKHFAQSIGCSPQKFIQVKRMNAALHMMWTGQYQKLSDVAHALNYYDQAHFIRDMKAFSWLSPKAITQSISDFRQDESGIAYV